MTRCDVTSDDVISGVVVELERGEGSLGDVTLGWRLSIINVTQVMRSCRTEVIEVTEVTRLYMTNEVT